MMTYDDDLMTFIDDDDDDDDLSNPPTCRIEPRTEDDDDDIIHETSTFALFNMQIHRSNSHCLHGNTARRYRKIYLLREQKR
jgi:hypothetical protein